MVQYLRKLEEVPGFSNIPLPGHEQAKTKAINKILIDPVTGSQNLMLLWAKHEPDSLSDMHAHPVEQAYYVLSGALKVRIAGQEFIANANSAVLLPAGVEHETVAHGQEPTTFLIVFAPPLDSFVSRPH